MTERELAQHVAKMHGKTIVDDMGGITLGGITLSEVYHNKWSAAGYDVWEAAQAIRHWVVCAGYNDGKFEVVMSDHILNA